MTDNSNEIQYLDTAALQLFQEQQLRVALRYAQEHSAYYKRVFSEHQVDVDAVDLKTEWQKIPFTSKEDLARYNPDFIAVPTNAIAEYVTTSGTLGSPVPIVLTDADLGRLAYNEASGLTISGITAHDIVLITTTLDRRFMAGLAYYLGLRRIGAATIRVGIGVPAMQWESIVNFKATALIGVPSFIVKLILYAQEQGIDIRGTAVRKLICIGEPIRYNSFELNKTGQFIQDHWGIEMYSTYASTEMATAFTECSYGCGGHELPDLIYTEVINPEGNVVPAGTPGELVFTTLGVEGMPLLRYRSGDVVVRFDTPCACGRTTHRIGPVVGRLGQMLKYKGTTIFPAAFQPLLDHLPEVETYVIEATTGPLGEDELTIYFYSKQDTDSIKAKIKAECKAQLRVTPNIEYRPAEYIQHIRNVPELRKPRIFVDNRHGYLSPAGGGA